MRRSSRYSAIVLLQVIFPLVDPFIVINGQVRGNMRNYSPNTPHFPTMQPGFCANPSPVPNFDMESFKGAWYAQRQTPSAFQTPDQTCARSWYGDGAGGTVQLWKTCTIYNGSVIQMCGSVSQQRRQRDQGLMTVVYVS